MNKEIKLLRIAGLVVLGTALPGAQVMAASEQYVNRYCKSAVATEYRVSQGEVRTLPVEKTGRKYKVYGQTPKDGENALFFTCIFDSSRNFLRLKKVSDKRSKSSRRASGEHHRHKQRHHSLRDDCKVAAAKEYGLHRKNITVQKAVRDKGGNHTVWGQFPSNQGSPTVFTCTFAGDHELVGIEINR